MPPPVKNFLTSEQIIQLQKALKGSEQPHVRERILILLLQNDGKPQREIAQFLGCSPRTVAYWCMHGDPDKLESLHNKREQESYRKATPEYIQLLVETVEKQPEELGYEFGRWTGERLATYLAAQTGIRLSGSQVRRIIKRKKFSYTWAKYSLEDKQNPEKRTEFKETLAKYLAITKEQPERLQVWFWDETGFSLRVIRRTSLG
jgi:transposase